ncbi:MAG: dTDP-4-dehydrorhamnose 3,5-epimerase [Deltaproteobacteria bacterium]|nr:dTDP-4-dehydrorhamnose 3,5-epimerase [Deltaproteobacteria bacterium]MBW2393053.1 dTDP-4-dehydrorhamnose 3,5-epimerase [Deltaproteobacteria bacterium]
MKFRRTSLAGVIVIEPDVHRDARGFFLESYHEEKYRDAGITGPFVQDNHSSSKRRTLRGLHAQLAPSQGKLVRVVRGEVLDVAVDVRVGSPTFGQHHAETLGADTHRQLWIPEGFLHGFLVLSDEAEVEYKVTSPYSPSGEIAVAWNDPELAIPWPESDPIVSERDASAPPLSSLRDRLPSY